MLHSRQRTQSDVSEGRPQAALVEISEVDERRYEDPSFEDSMDFGRKGIPHEEKEEKDEEKKQE